MWQLRALQFEVWPPDAVSVLIRFN